MGIKLIASDIDGTIINSNNEVSAYTRSIIHSLKEYGIHFVLATGRAYEGGLDVAEQLDIVSEGYGLICLNGLRTYHFPQETYHELESLTYQECLNLEKLGMHYYMGILYCYDDVIYLQMDDVTYRDYRIALDEDKLKFFNERMRPTAIRSFAEIEHRFERGDTIQKVVFIQSDSFMDLVVDRVRKDLPDNLDALRVGLGWTEIMPKHVNKGQAVLEYAKTLGISKEEILVFGDAENDISMFQATGRGIVMENGMPSLKNIAFDTTATNDENGVAVYIREYLDTLKGAAVYE